LPANWKNKTAAMPNLSRLQRQAYRCFEQGDLAQTEKLCGGILEHRPEDFDALHLLGLLNFQRRRMVEALHFLTAALKTNFGSSDALSNLGLALQATGRHEEALSRYREALLITPDHPEILYNLGNACLELGRIEEALSSYDRADAAMPGHAQILTNRGHALRRLDRPVEALRDFKTAVAASPEFPEAHFEAAMAQLSLGDFEAGWKAYEWRWKTAAFARHAPHPKATLWLGQQPVAGKTILLHAEQGLGDTLQFIRYARLLADRGAKVICEVQPELQPLLSQLEGVTVIAAGASRPMCDLHCPMLSLPLAFGTRLATVPPALPHLVAWPERQAYWQDRLPHNRSRIGFVWAGQASHKNDRNRSISLSRLAPLFEDLRFACVGLQRDLRDGDSDVMAKWPNLTHLGDALRDFADTAAVISMLDMVISVDTSVAHLAGAMGKPVMVLLPHAADFRWMRDRDDTPWYPTAKLFRQTSFGDWDSVIARVCDHIRP
jgi:Tfp pilus assembly protein PilF